MYICPLSFSLESHSWDEVPSSPPLLLITMSGPFPHMGLQLEETLFFRPVLSTQTQTGTRSNGVYCVESMLHPTLQWRKPWGKARVTSILSKLCRLYDNHQTSKTIKQRSKHPMYSPHRPVLRCENNPILFEWLLTTMWGFISLYINWYKYGDNYCILQQVQISVHTHSFSVLSIIIRYCLVLFIDPAAFPCFSIHHIPNIIFLSYCQYIHLFRGRTYPPICSWYHIPNEFHHIWTKVFWYHMYVRHNKLMWDK